MKLPNCAVGLGPLVWIAPTIYEFPFRSVAISFPWSSNGPPPTLTQRMFPVLSYFVRKTSEALQGIVMLSKRPGLLIVPVAYALPAASY